MMESYLLQALWPQCQWQSARMSGDESQDTRIHLLILPFSFFLGRRVNYANVKIMHIRWCGCVLPSFRRSLYQYTYILKIDFSRCLCVWVWKNLYKSHLCSASSAKTNDGNKFTRAQDQNKDNADCQNQSQPEMLFLYTGKSLIYDNLKAISGYWTSTYN